MTDGLGKWWIVGPEDHLIIHLPESMGRTDVEAIRQAIPESLRDRTLIMVDFEARDESPAEAQGRSIRTRSGCTDNEANSG